MDYIARFFAIIWDAFDMKIRIYGFEFSWKEIFVVVTLGGMVFSAIRDFFND